MKQGWVENMKALTTSPSLSRCSTWVSGAVESSRSDSSSGTYWRESMSLCVLNHPLRPGAPHPEWRDTQDRCFSTLCHASIQTTQTLGKMKRYCRETDSLLHTSVSVICGHLIWRRYEILLFAWLSMSKSDICHIFFHHYPTGNAVPLYRA